MSQQTLERKCWVIHRGDGPPIAVFSAKGAEVYIERGHEGRGAVRRDREGRAR